VLSDPNAKAVYDKYGMAALPNKITEEGINHQGYLYSGDSYGVFRKVFGTNNPFGENFKNPDEIRLVDQQPPSADEPKDIDVVLPCTISEFYNGALKSFQFTRSILMPDGRS
jgi:DnaJ-class molecular chaperone